MMDMIDGDLLNHGMYRLDGQLQKLERNDKISNVRARQTLRFLRDVFDITDRGETRWRQAYKKNPGDGEKFREIEDRVFEELAVVVATRGEYDGTRYK